MTSRQLAEIPYKINSPTFCLNAVLYVTINPRQHVSLLITESFHGQSKYESPGGIIVEQNGDQNQHDFF